MSRRGGTNRATWLDARERIATLLAAPRPPGVSARSARHARALLESLADDVAALAELTQRERADALGVVDSTLRRHEAAERGANSSTASKS